jgi:outer membrane protein assembly factor BamB
MPGGMLSLSAQGSDQTTAVIWASLPKHDDAFVSDVPGVLRAFDPYTLIEIWNNESEPQYNFAKYCPPTVANGRVFLATFSNQIIVYGLQ